DGVTASFSRLTSVAVQPSAMTINVGQQSPRFTSIGTFTNAATRSLVDGMGSWSTKRSLLYPTFDFGLGALHQMVYAVGGGIAGAPSAIVEVYNPVVGSLGLTDAWCSTALSSACTAPVAQLHTPREGHGVAAVGGKLYAIGGSTTGNVPIGSVEAY